MEEFRAHSGLERCGARFDESQAEVNVAEQLSFVGLRKGGSGAKLGRSPDVVQDRSGQ